MSFSYKRKPVNILGSDRSDVDREFGIKRPSWDSSPSYSSNHGGYGMKSAQNDDSLDSFFDHPTSIKAQRENEKRRQREEAERQAKEQAEQRERERKLSELRQQHGLRDKPWDPKDNMFNHPSSIVNRELAERKEQEQSLMSSPTSLGGHEGVALSSAHADGVWKKAARKQAQMKQANDSLQQGRWSQTDGSTASYNADAYAGRNSQKQTAPHSNAQHTAGGFSQQEADDWFQQMPQGVFDQMGKSVQFGDKALREGYEREKLRRRPGNHNKPQGTNHPSENPNRKAGPVVKPQRMPDTKLPGGGTVQNWRATKPDANNNNQEDNRRPSGATGHAGHGEVRTNKPNAGFNRGGHSAGGPHDRGVGQSGYGQGASRHPNTGFGEDGQPMVNPPSDIDATHLGKNPVTRGAGKTKKGTLRDKNGKTRGTKQNSSKGRSGNGGNRNSGNSIGVKPKICGLGAVCPEK